MTTEGEPDFDLTTTTTIDNITEDSFVIRVEFGADTRTLVYGYGSADDLEAFENGTLSTITKVTNPTANTIIGQGYGARSGVHGLRTGSSRRQERKRIDGIRQDAENSNSNLFCWKMN